MRRRIIIALISLGGAVLLGFLTFIPNYPRGQTIRTSSSTLTYYRKEGSLVTSWETGPRLPVRLSEVATVSVGNSIFVAGGLTSEGKASDHFLVLDPVKGEWKQLDPLPKPLHHASMVASEDEIYLIGGYNDLWEPQDRIYVYRTSEGSWDTLVKLPKPVAAATAQLIGSEIHVFGGARGGFALNEHVVVDLYAMSVREEVPLRVAREHLASATWDGKIYVVGGRAHVAGRLRNLNTLEIFDVQNRTLRGGPPMPTARSGIAAVSVRGRVLVFGGESETRTFGEVEAFDTATSSWSHITTMPTPRHGLGAAAVGDRVYLIAGGPRPGLSMSDLTEVLVLRDE